MPSECPSGAHVMMPASLLLELGRGHGGDDDGKPVAFAFHVVKPPRARVMHADMAELGVAS